MTESLKVILNVQEKKTLRKRFGESELTKK
jgi:hypothetical protein